MENYEYDLKKINTLADGLSIVDYLDSIGMRPEKKSGRNWYYLCSVSGEDHASLAVDTEKNYYHCFSCQNGGNLLNLMVTHLRIPFREACQKILDLANVDIDDITVIEKSDTLKYLQKLKREHEKKPNEYIRIYENYADYDKFSKDPAQLWINEGIPADIQRRYDIRTDPARNRILYPLRDQNDVFITKKQRSTLSSNVLKKFGIPKYRIDGKVGTVDFVVGWHENAAMIQESGEVIVFEAIKSVMKLSIFGQNIGVAAETSVLNHAQIQFLIKQRISKIVIAFDKDKKLNEIKQHLWILPRFANVSIIIDKDGLLGEKDSPVDCGKKTWEKLYSNRIKLN